MAKKKQQIINPGVKEGIFFKLDDFNTQVEMGRDFIENVIPAKVFLYRIDRIKTKTHILYNECFANEKVTLPKIELSIKFNIEDSESENIGNSQINIQWSQDLVFTVYDLELEEKKCDILKGDFISIIGGHNKIVYYEVYDNDKNNISNLKTIAGIKSFYRKVRCKYVNSDIFFPNN